MADFTAAGHHPGAGVVVHAKARPRGANAAATDLGGVWIVAATGYVLPTSCTMTAAPRPASSWAYARPIRDHLP